MKDERKTKKQLLQELKQERERSDALYQVSNTSSVSCAPASLLETW